MINELFSYQLSGSSWLSCRKVALLADEMGLGKSAQVVKAAETLAKPGITPRILIVCPAIARTNWAREFELWSNSLRPTAIVSFEYAVKHLKTLAQEKWGLLVVDEVHYAKSVTAKRTHSILGKHGLCHAAERVWVLSGTPAPNHAGELYPLMRVFGATALSHAAFIDRYCDTIPSSFGVGYKVVGTKKANLPELRQALSKIMIRRTKASVAIELPPISFSTLVVEPGNVPLSQLAIGGNSHPDPTAQILAPEEFLETLRARLKADTEKARSVVDSANDTAALEALAASVSTLRRYNGLQKVEPAIDTLTFELDANLYAKIVVFAVHKQVVSSLVEGLKAFGAVAVSGDTPQTHRQANVDRFQRDPACRVFVGNITAAGTAITLTAAHHVIFVEQDWVPGNNAQAAMRCHRIGQQSPVTVRFLSTSTPLEERIVRALERKTADLAKIFS